MTLDLARGRAEGSIESEGNFSVARFQADVGHVRQPRAALRSQPGDSAGWRPHAALGLRLTSEMAFGDGPGRAAVTDGFVDLWAQGRFGGGRGGNFTYVAAGRGPTLFFGNFAHERAAIGVLPAYGFGLGSLWKVHDRLGLGVEANASPFPAIGIESWRWGIHVTVHRLPRLPRRRGR